MPATHWAHGYVYFFFDARTSDGADAVDIDPIERLVGDERLEHQPHRVPRETR